MWISSKILDWFKISQESFSNLKEENAALRTERDSVQRQLNITQTNFEWLRMQVNTLQFERTALLEKAYGIRVPSPEIVRTPVIGSDVRMEDFNFNDIGDDMAKQMGLPIYGEKH